MSEEEEIEDPCDDKDYREEAEADEDRYIAEQEAKVDAMREPITEIDALGDKMITALHTKIVGVTFEGRQELVANLKEGDELILSREPNNEYDSNAVAVLNKEGYRVGYIKKALAEELSEAIFRGIINFKCKVSNLTGEEGQSKGVNILITREIGTGS